MLKSASPPTVQRTPSSSVTQIILTQTGKVKVDSAPKPARKRTDTLLFRSSGSPMRVLTVVAFAFAVGSVLLATLLLDRTVQMTHMITWEERLIWASGLFFIFTGFFFAVWNYEKRMASRLVLLSNGRDLRVTTPTLFGAEDHDFPVEDVIDTQYHEGDRVGEEASSTPWLYVRVKGRPSFVVSLSGVIPNRQQLLEVLSTTK
jgi:hypothetical protein